MMLVWLNYVFNLIVSFLDPRLLDYWFYPLVCLCFLASIPAIIRCLISWR